MSHLHFDCCSTGTFNRTMHQLQYCYVISGNYFRMHHCACLVSDGRFSLLHVYHPILTCDEFQAATLYPGTLRVHSDLSISIVLLHHGKTFFCQQKNSAQSITIIVSNYLTRRKITHFKQAIKNSDITYCKDRQPNKRNQYGSHGF